MRCKPVTWQLLSDNLLKLEHRACSKNCPDALWKLAKTNTALHLLTHKSERNHMHISTSLHTKQATQFVKRRRHKRSLIKPVQSNYSPRAPCGLPQHFQRPLWPATEKIFKFQICFKACEVRFCFIELRALDKVYLHKQGSGVGCKISGLSKNSDSYSWLRLLNMEGMKCVC